MTQLQFGKFSKWASIKLDEIANDGLQNGIYKPDTAYGQGTAIVRINDFDNDGHFSISELQRLDLSANEIERYKVQVNDILINRVNSLSHIGKSVIIKEVTEPTVYESNMMRLRLDSDILLADYFARLLQTPTTRNYFRKVAKKAVAQASINQEDIKSLEFLLPPLPEQRKIAEILSTWDEAIDLTAQLIAAKQRRKQALMQQLLTGKVRFPGFEDEWEKTTLEDICVKFLNGGTPSTSNKSFWGGSIPWITGADIVNQRISSVRSYVTDEGVRKSATNVIQKGNLLVVTRTGVGKLAIAPFDLAISQDLTGVYVNHKKVIPTFLFYYLDFRVPLLTRLNQGTSINGITRQALVAAEVTIPQKEEQEKLISVFETCDQELDLLQQKLAALRQQKQGLMQQLLTGKVRVIV